MDYKITPNDKSSLLLCISFLILLLSMPVSAAEDVVKPGSYCPDTNILLIVAEELSVSLDFSMRSRQALIENKLVLAADKLHAAGTTLHLAASRGAAARTILLIDAIIGAMNGEDYTQTLTLFPLLQASLLTLQDQATVRSANDNIANAQDIMQGEKKGDPIDALKKARHTLACDGLDIPLQAAMQAQEDLVKVLGQDTKATAYDKLIGALRNALTYTLENSKQ
jgi:hypothetical protein